MLFGRAILPLTPLWERDNPVALVPPIKAMDLCREEGYEKLPAREALRHFSAMDHLSSWQVRQFVSEARLTTMFLSETADWELAGMLRNAIKTGDLVALRKSNKAGKPGDATAEQRRLVRSIDKQTRGRLNFAGRQYKPVVDVDLGKVPGRNSYEVANRDEALRVLDGLAKESATTSDLGALLGQASAKLTPDWRPPSQPDGLILLRRIRQSSAPEKDTGPAITPSQIKAMMGSKEHTREYLPVDRPVQLALRLTCVEGLYKPGFVADGDTAPKGSGYQEGYLSDDDKGRIFVNHKPRTKTTQGWDDVLAKDTQFIDLFAEVDVVQGTMSPEARVEWEWFDPNDDEHPESHAHGARVPDEVDVDGKPRKAKNRGTCDYPNAPGKDMARFAQNGDFGFADGATVMLCDTEIKEGKSGARLHVSNVAGDNFVVKARIKKSPCVTPNGQKQTGVMTVWKRIDVEYVRMADAFALPIAKVPPFFEPARVQMDFSVERTVPAKPFLAVLDKDEEAACANYASAGKGEFNSEGKPGWFFLAAAQRASSEFFSAPGPADAQDAGSTEVYIGKAKVAVVTGSDQNWEKLIVDKVIVGKVSFMTVHDTQGGPHGYMGVWKKEVIGGKTHLHLDGLDYASDFVVTKGKDTGRLGNPGKGGAYDKMDYYYLRHRLRQPSMAWEPGGMGFGEEVFIRARPPGSVETSGLSPPARYAGKEYFAGRLLIFTRAFAATSLDEDDAVSTIVHEFTHAFGYPHKCGYYGWPEPPLHSCSMNYFSTWLYAIGTRTLQRFVFGTSGAHLCSKHLAGVREVHLEDNPAIWKW